MKITGDSTHPYRSPAAATMNGRDLTILTRTQTSNHEYSYLTPGRQHHTPATLHKPFQEEPGRMLSRVRQSMCRRLWHTPKISQKFAGKWNLVNIARAGTKTALGIIQVWFNYFAASFFNALVNVNVNYLKSPKKHRGPHRRPSRAACLRPLV